MPRGNPTSPLPTRLKKGFQNRFMGRTPSDLRPAAAAPMAAPAPAAPAAAARVMSNPLASPHAQVSWGGVGSAWNPQSLLAHEVSHLGSL